MTPLLLRASVSLWLVGALAGCAKDADIERRLASSEQRFLELARRIDELEAIKRNEKTAAMMIGKALESLQAEVNALRASAEQATRLKTSFDELSAWIKQNHEATELRYNLQATANKVLFDGYNSNSKMHAELLIAFSKHKNDISHNRQ